MGSALKAMPVLPKVPIGCLILEVIYKASQGPTRSATLWLRLPGRNFESQVGRETGSRRTNAPDAARQSLAQLQAQQQQLLAHANQCATQINLATANGNGCHERHGGEQSACL
jgi:hypothetical protein